jgi:hypothetical protein
LILSLIFRANIQLAAQQAISQHMVIRLNKALQIEQKRRKKGKQLNLLGKDDVRP